MRPAVRRWLLPLVIGLCSILGGLYGPGLSRTAAASPESDLRGNLQTFTKFYEAVESNFAEPVSPDRAFYQGAIPGMLRTLDPHSSFLDPKTYQLLQQEQRGQYYGVGMEINMDGPRVIVFQPFPGSPAYQAGVRRGDVIHAIDDQSAEGLTSVQVADRLKGPRGTKVKLTVLREGVQGPISFLITRGEISRSTVDGWVLRPGIAFVRIESFSNQNTGREIEEKLKELHEQAITGLILDLRGNPGGLVSEAVSVASHFLENGQIVVSHHGRASPEQVFRAKSRNRNATYPIVVMVDRFSASASEIVAGALQDHDRAWILGESTFGKGLVQAQFPLSEGAALLLTIARYYTPSGRLIQRDYAHESFFEYYYRRNAESKNPRDVKMTDSGRTVYGGGGITPDEKFASPKRNAFQRRLAARLAFFRFGSEFFGGGPLNLPKNWTPDAAIFDRFKQLLRQQEVPFTDADFEQNKAWIGQQLQLELLTRVYGKSAADRVAVDSDPEAQKAVLSLPTARSLLERARRVVALRN